jgi:hypothetical protein
MSVSEPTAAPIPNTYTTTTLVGGQLVTAMGPWITLHLAWLLDAIGAMFQQVASLVYDVGTDGQAGYVPGYGTALDPTKAAGSELAYLGQFVGVQIPAGLTDTQARALITTEAGFVRGTPAAVLSAAKPWLLNTQSVTLVERQGPTGAHPDFFQLIVRPEELLWNAVPNPNFEHNTPGAAAAGWDASAQGPVATSSTQVASTAQAHSGGQSMAVTVPGTALTKGTSIPIGSVASGATVSAAVWVYVGTTQNVTIELEDNVLGNGPQSATVSAQANTWTRLSVSWTATASSANARVYVFLQAAAAAQTFYVDDAIAVPGSLPPDFFATGDQAPLAWSGTPGNSTTTSATALTAAVNAVKPGGIMWQLVQSDAYTWSQAIHTWSADTMTWAQTTSTQP